MRIDTQDSDCRETAPHTKDRSENDWCLDALRNLALCGDEAAQLGLGEAYLNGRHGLFPDQYAAQAWLMKAVAQGNTTAMLRLSGMYLATAVEALKPDGLYWLAQAFLHGGDAETAAWDAMSDIECGDFMAAAFDRALDEPILIEH